MESKMWRRTRATQTPGPHPLTPPLSTSARHRRSSAAAWTSTSLAMLTMLAPLVIMTSHRVAAVGAVAGDENPHSSSGGDVIISHRGEMDTFHSGSSGDETSNRNGGIGHHRNRLLSYEFLDLDFVASKESLFSSMLPSQKSAEVRTPGRGKNRGRRLQTNTAPTAAAPAAAGGSYEMGPFDAPIITVALTQVPTAGPRSRRYFAFWRPFNSTQDKSAATFDLNSGTVYLIRTQYDQFCNGPIVQADGNTALFGGYNDAANKVQADGRRVITAYNDLKGKIYPLANMTYRRWYPTPCMTADKKILIVGGTEQADKGGQIPVAELWDPTRPTRAPANITMPPRFSATAGLNWYPFIALLPRGEILWWGDRGGSITNTEWREIYVFPEMPTTFPYRTMYKYTSTIILNALKPDPRTGEYNSFSMTIFGGAPDGASQYTPASNLSARIDLYYCGANVCDHGWVVENMSGERRVMATSTVLPNGNVVISGGGQAGYAGWKSRGKYKATLPAFRDLVYNPEAPLGNRYALSNTKTVIRMYHAASCLDLSGKVISSGCETCGMKDRDAGVMPSTVVRTVNFSDYDYRISFMVPAEIGPLVTRPVITTAPRNIVRGSVFQVAYNYPGGGDSITGATLAAPCANTHSINMNQRVLFLILESAANGVATIRAPPLSQPAAAHEGYYLLYLLGDNGTPSRSNTYSEGVWVNLQDASSRN